MPNKVRLAGASAAAFSALLAFVPTAFGDSANDNGVNGGNGNNASVIPVQLCNDNVAAAVGVIVPLLSPTSAQCTNAPVVDHPVASGGSEQQPPEQPGTSPVQPGTPPVQPGTPPEHKVQPPKHHQPGPSAQPNGGGELPYAPAPSPIAGHHAVTG